jgi:pimeloyl-ACP methyl ester carboxylesterase
MLSTKESATNPTPGQYWEWRGHKIYYVQSGISQQYPPLLLVHGFGASTDHWRKNIIALTADFSVFAIDLLGFGRSAKPKLQYSGELWRDQLYDFIHQVIGQPAILAGNSLGGYACLTVAAQYPQIVAGLVLLNSAGPFSQPQPDQSEIRTNQKPMTQLFSKATRKIFQQSLFQFLLFQYVRQPWVIRRTLEKVYLDKSAVTDQLVAEIRRPADDPGAIDVFVSVFSTPQGEKVDVLLQRLTCPLLLIWGEFDPWMNARERSPQFQRYYPPLTEIFLKAGHCPHDEVPEQVNSHLRRWIVNLFSREEV